MRTSSAPPPTLNYLLFVVIILLVVFLLLSLPLEAFSQESVDFVEPELFSATQWEEAALAQSVMTRTNGGLAQ